MDTLTDGASTAPAPASGASRERFAPWEDPSAVPLISYRSVTKRFGDVVAVDDLSLDIYPNEFFALLGPSGCGKTTLMRMLAGFEEPTDGAIYLGDRDITGVPPHRRPVNMMFQSYALFPHLSVWDNVAFGLRREGLGKAELTARVEEMLDLVQLTGQARRRPEQLSGGQQQRVALARSLAKRPKVLLLDEPLAALDKKLRGETQFQLVNLQDRLGITFLIVTHDQEEAMVLGCRIAVMRDGRIEQVAPPDVLYESPASRFVADFVGDVNLFEGTVTGTDETATLLACEGVPGGLAVAARENARAGTRATIAVRPEKLAIHHRGEPPAGARNALVGRVEDMAYMGDYTLFRVRTPAGLVEASRLNRRRFDADPIAWDDEVALTFELEDGVFLDR